MNDRTHIAAMALQGLLAGNVAAPREHENPSRFLAGVAVSLADELLAALAPTHRTDSKPPAPTDGQVPEAAAGGSRAGRLTEPAEGARKAKEILEKLEGPTP